MMTIFESPSHFFFRSIVDRTAFNEYAAKAHLALNEREQADRYIK